MTVKKTPNGPKPRRARRKPSYPRAAGVFAVLAVGASMGCQHPDARLGGEPPVAIDSAAPSTDRAQPPSGATNTPATTTTSSASPNDGTPPSVGPGNEPPLGGAPMPPFEPAPSASQEGPSR